MLLPSWPRYGCYLHWYEVQDHNALQREYWRLKAIVAATSYIFFIIIIFHYLVPQNQQGGLTLNRTKFREVLFFSPVMFFPPWAEPEYLSEISDVQQPWILTRNFWRVVPCLWVINPTWQDYSKVCAPLNTLGMWWTHWAPLPIV